MLIHISREETAGGRRGLPGQGLIVRVNEDEIVSVSATSVIPLGRGAEQSLDIDERGPDFSCQVHVH